MLICVYSLCPYRSENGESLRVAKSGEKCSIFCGLIMAEDIGDSMSVSETGLTGVRGDMVGESTFSGCSKKLDSGDGTSGSIICAISYDETIGLGSSYVCVIWVVITDVGKGLLNRPPLGLTTCIVEILCFWASLRLALSVA